MPNTVIVTAVRPIWILQGSVELQLMWDWILCHKCLIILEICFEDLPKFSVRSCIAAAWHPSCVVLVASCPRRRRVPRQEESIVRGVPATCLLKSSLSREGSGPHIIQGSLDPHESHSNDISICSAIFARLTRLPNTLTTLCTTTLIACVEKGLITSHQETLLPARRCASARASCGPVSVSVCLCLSVTSRCSNKRDKRINLVFGMEASFDQSYTLF